MVGAGTSTPSDERSGEGARGKGRQRPPPSSSPAGERKGARGKVRERPPPSSPPAGERKGAGGKVRARQPCAAVPALQPVHPCSIHQDAGQRPALPARNHCVRGPPCFRASPPTSPLPLPVWERKGAGGKVRERPPPSSPPAGARKGAGGKVRAASRAPQHRDGIRCPPSHRGRATHTLPANGSHQQRSGTYRLECHCRTASTIQVFDHALRQQYLQCSSPIIGSTLHVLPGSATALQHR